MYFKFVLFILHTSKYESHAIKAPKPTKILALRMETAAKSIGGEGSHTDVMSWRHCCPHVPMSRRKKAVCAIIMLLFVTKALLMFLFNYSINTI